MTTDIYDDEAPVPAPEAYGDMVEDENMEDSRPAEEMDTQEAQPQPEEVESEMGNGGRFT